MIKIFESTDYLLEDWCMGLINNVRTIYQIYRNLNEFNYFLSVKQTFTNIALEDQGVVQEYEISLLQELVTHTNGFPGPLIEIGTLFGFTTQKIAFWKDAGKKIITVDNYCWNPRGITSDDHHHLTCKILWYLIQTGHVELLKMSKDVFFKNYQGEAPSLVFIDADHSYEATLSDIRESQRIGAQIICGHDYNDDHPGVTRAVDECGGATRLCGSVWVL